MIAAERTALVLLAAGRSLRFGERDKLEQPFLGQPLAFHVVTALEGVPFLARFAIVSNTMLDFASRDYRVIANPAPETGMAGSLRLGVAAARAARAEAIVVALADMPRVTAAHILRLLDAAGGADAVVASSNGVDPCPPCVFGAGMFGELLEIQGDEGARAVIRGGHHVIAPATQLVDVDTPEDLAVLQSASIK